MRYELSVKADYVRDWGVREAFREFVANSLDAGTEIGAETKVAWKKARGVGVVRVETVGVRVPREALLFGFSTKQDNNDTIGHFGEGLKLACLAAVRAGHEVRISSGRDVWAPKMESSKVFPGESVLVFHITEAKTEASSVVVELKGIEEEQWQELRGMFLQLAGSGDRVDTQDGSLLRSPEHRGRIFVKGVFVDYDAELGHGYDLRYAKTDRDRKIVNRWDLDFAIRQIWTSAAMSDARVLDALYLQLCNETKDTRQAFAETTTSFLNGELRKQLARKFEEQHGQNAVAVKTLAESQRLEHLGAKGVVLPRALASIVAYEKGGVEEIHNRLKNSPVRRYSWGELSDVRKASLDRALCIVGQVRDIGLDDIDIVDFVDEKLLGTWNKGRISIAARVLDDEKAALRVLVHEVAHGGGEDGTKDYSDGLQALWSDIVEVLWR